MKRFLLFISIFLSSIIYSQKETKLTRILFIFDGSNSMNAQWQNKSKIEVAKKLMYETVDTLKNVDNLQIALRMYGHQVKILPGQQDCDDTKLEVPFGNNNHSEIKTKIKWLEPKGTTPIARSLLYSAEDFPPCDDCRNIIILITDGIEACDEDPCAVSKALNAKGISIKPYIIGIDLDVESILKFKCVGKYYDASTEETFRSVMRVVMSEALDNTTAQVDLLDIKKKATETNVNMTFYDQRTGVIKYNYLHTMNENNLPDTIKLDPLTTYRIEVHTIPKVVKENVKIKAGEHNTIKIDAPQGFLDLKVNGVEGYSNILAIVRRKGEMNTIEAQRFYTTTKYIVGTYDLEILTIPRIYMYDVKINQSKTTKIEIPKSGIVNFRFPYHGYGGIYYMKDDKLELVSRIKNDTYLDQHSLQPGRYKIIFRSNRVKRSAYTVEKEFIIKSGEITEVKL